MHQNTPSLKINSTSTDLGLHPQDSERKFTRGPMKVLFHAEEASLVAGAYKTKLDLPSYVEPHLREVLQQILSHPGSLFRGQLVLRLMHMAEMTDENGLNTAIAIEYFHSSSLIFDDLICMDDGIERRGQPCAHKIHGEAPAILAALALINRAYGLVWSVLSGFPQNRRQRATRLLEDCLGLSSILNGQAKDLFFGDQFRTQRDVAEVSVGKTGSLFRLAFLLPAIMAGHSDREIKILNRYSVLFSLLYQLLDDFKDVLSNPLETGKTTSRDEILARPNYVIKAGGAKALDRLEQLFCLQKKIIKKLTTLSPKWGELHTLQNYFEKESNRLTKGLRLSAAFHNYGHVVVKGST